MQGIWDMIVRSWRTRKVHLTFGNSFLFTMATLTTRSREGWRSSWTIIYACITQMMEIVGWEGRKTVMWWIRKGKCSCFTFLAKKTSLTSRISILRTTKTAGSTLISQTLKKITILLASCPINKLLKKPKNVPKPSSSLRTSSSSMLSHKSCCWT